MAYSSPDNSITITAPIAEGDGYEVQIATSYISSTNSITTTKSGAPPVITPTLASTLLMGTTNAYASINVSGTFNILADWSTFATMGNLITVGGVIGNIPNSSTLLEAVTVYSSSLATATYTSPWCILMFPGTYTGENVTIPSNVYLIAFQPGTVILGDNISYTALSTDLTSVQFVTGIIFTGTFIFDTTAKPTNGVNSTLVVKNCTFSSSFSANMRPNGISGDNNDYYKDNMLIIECTFSSSSSSSYVGGLTNLRDCTVGGTVITGNSSGTGTATIMQILNCIISSTSLNIYGNTSLFSIRGSILKNNWNASGTSVVIIDACQVDSTWILTNTTSPPAVYIYNTYLPYTLTRNTTTNWSLSFPNLAGTSGIDRPCRFTLLNPPTNISILTISLAAYISQFTTSDGSGTNYTVPPVSMIQLSGTTSSQVSTGSTTTSLNIVSNVSTSGGDDRVCVEINPPIYSGTTWYV